MERKQNALWRTVVVLVLFGVAFGYVEAAIVVYLGELVIIVAFCWDYRRVMAGGMPNSFPWSIFLVGEAIGLAGFCLALIRSGRSRHRITI